MEMPELLGYVQGYAPHQLAPTRSQRTLTRSTRTANPRGQDCRSSTRDERTTMTLILALLATYHM